jgi:hypothetical protein
MEWWYKSDDKPINQETIFKLQDAIKSVLRDGKSLAQVSLYDDTTSFFIKVNNKFALNHFLFQNGFEETDEDLPKPELKLHFGAA